MKKFSKTLTLLALILLTLAILSSCKQNIDTTYEITPVLLFELSAFGDSADEYIDYAVHNNGNLIINTDNSFVIDISDYEYTQQSTSKTQTITITKLYIEGAYDKTTLTGNFTGNASITVKRTDIQQSSPEPSDTYEYQINISGTIDTYEETGYINMKYLDEFSYTYNKEPDKLFTGTYRHTITYEIQD
ncbi:MAG TPA: hypothetical protein PLS36_09550 [Clostridia bacterium]|nr:hypothetical protein [Clostridia bacterium]HXK72639.1 hypothetical protein [Clostridia bacterium]